MSDSDADRLRMRVGPGAPVTLRFWRDGDQLYVIATGAPPAWYLAAVRGDPVRIEDPPSTVAAYAAHPVVDGAEIRSVEIGFQARYGARVWDRHFAGERRVLRIGRSNPPPGADEGSRLRAEFDAAAPAYAERIEADPVDAELRHRSVPWLVGTTSGRDPILEIGGGTGVETIPLLTAGHTVMTVDVSPRMLGALRDRLGSLNLSARWSGRVARLGSIGEDLAELPPGAFGAAVSTFGAFNLEPDLRAAGRGLARLLRPDAPLLVGTLSPYGVAPVAFALARGDGREIRGRLRNPMPPGGTRYPLEVYARDAVRLARDLGAGFEAVDDRPGTLLLPPHDQPRFRRLLGARGWDRWVRADRWLVHRGIGRPFAEWRFVELRRAARTRASALL